MTEFTTPTLGRIDMPTEFGGSMSIRVTTLGGRLRIMFDSSLIAGMLDVAHQHGRADRWDMADYLNGENEMPIGTRS